MSPYTLGKEDEYKKASIVSACHPYLPSYATTVPVQLLCIISPSPDIQRLNPLIYCHHQPC